MGKPPNIKSGSSTSQAPLRSDLPSAPGNGLDGIKPFLSEGQLRELLEYARDRLQAESMEDPTWPTFECRVNSLDALTWLDRNRPEVAERIKMSR